MSDMYSRISELCKNKGVSVTQMCKELSITRSCLSELSKGRTENLSVGNTSKIAAYFGVSAEYLATGEKNSQTSASEEDIKFALFNGSEGITDEMFAEVKQFAQMVKQREMLKKE